MTGRWFWPLACTLDHLEFVTRQRTVQWVYRIPYVWRFKAIRKLAFLQELYSLLAQHGTNAYVVGGFAYDGLRGQLTRPHADSDICLLEDDLPRAVEYLSQHGYKIECYTPYKYRAWKSDLYAELYVWRRCGPGAIEHIAGGRGARIPKAFFQVGGTVNLSGVQFKIPTIEYMVSALAFMQNDEERLSFHEEDRRYVMKLAQLPVAPRVRPERIQVTFTVEMYDFCDWRSSLPQDFDLAEPTGASAAASDPC